MFISPAFAQDAAPGGADLLTSFLPLILIVAIFYFLLIRPQQKKQKEHQAKINAVRRNDHVLTGGGIYGRVTKVLEDGKIQVEIAEGVRVKTATSTLMDVIAKPEPANAAKSSKGKGDKEEAEEKE